MRRPSITRPKSIGSALLACATALSITTTSLAQLDGAEQGDGGPVRYDGHSVVRVKIDTIRTLRTMMALSPDCWSESIGIGTLDFRIPPDRMNALQKSGVPFELLIADVQELIDQEKAWHANHQWVPGSAAGGLAGGADFFDDYRRVEEIYAWFDELIEQYPTLITKSEAGTSIEGRTIWAYQITAPTGSEKRGICVNGMAHAREWISPMTVCWLAKSLLEGYGPDVQITGIMEDIRWHILPVMNPDGYTYAWDENRLWRKTRRNNGDGTFGVDWNRNFDSNWSGPGSSSNTNSDIYHGPAAFSEPETQALRDYILNRPTISAHVDVHSYSQLMLYPYGYQESVPPGSEGTVLATLAVNMADAIASYEGRIYDPIPAHDLYVASGVSDDWSYDAANTLSYTPELRDTGQFGFILPANQIIPTGSEMLLAFKTLAEAVRERVFVVVPGGWPSLVDAGVGTGVTVDVAPTWNRNAEVTGLEIVPQSGPPIALVDQGLGRWTGSIPALSCGETINAQLRISDSDGGSFLWPRDGSFLVTSATESTVLVEDDIESDLGWSVENDGALTAGGWERGVPSGDDTSVNQCSAPGSDSDGSGSCWVTGNGNSSFACEFDIDGGITRLTSPIYAVEDATASIGFSWWYDNTSANNTEYDDDFVVEISGDDGVSWSPLFSRSNGDSAQTGWSQESFVIAEYVQVIAGVRLRFTASDNAPGSVVEAGVDAIRVTLSGCPEDNPADFNGDGFVNGVDLAALLASWGPCIDCPEDINGDGVVGGPDIATLLAAWTG
ncbi:MAG: M14 family zinc carboxypeptidase [Planctomycetota bacterium]|nr:M14 family zinc carboxypeptidase [Planctomycetota bacterium]